MDDKERARALETTLGGHTITALGDVDGDSVPDFAVGGQMVAEPSYVISGATLTVKGKLPGQPLGITGDLDGDGHADVLCSSRRGDRLMIVSATDADTSRSFDVRDYGDRHRLSVWQRT